MCEALGGINPTQLLARQPVYVPIVFHSQDERTLAETDASNIPDGSIDTKNTVEHYEVANTDAGIDREELGDDVNRPSPSAAAELVAFDRKILTKLDDLIVPLMATLYLLVFVDRTNIGNARVAGLQRDLGLTDHQYKTRILTED